MINKNSIIEAKKYLGASYFDDLNISFEKGNDGLLLVEKKENKVVVNYSKDVEAFFALTLIKQNYRKQNYSIKLKSRFKHTGVMHDCSRNGVVNISKAKEMILIHALLGLNRFMFYTEDTYEIEGEPYFGYMRGRYTKEEIKDLVEYAEGFGVEVVPCIQTLSHLNQALRWTNSYGKVMSSGCTLKIGEEKTYELIEKMFKTISSSFKSEYVHIGMDEAIDIGLFDYLNKGEAKDKKALMLNHIKRVAEIAKKYNKKVIMWGDMFFKVDSKATPDWYDFVGKLDKDIKEAIPEGFELIYWDYYHNDYETYDKMMKIFKDTGHEVMFGSGMIRWIGFVPNYDCSFLKCSQGLKAAIKNKINDVLATTWGDGGGENSVISVYPFLALHSVFDYYGNGKISKVNSLLKTITGLSYEQWRSLQLPNMVTGKELLPFENPSKPFLYNDPLLGLFDERADESYQVAYKNNAKVLSKLSKKSNNFGYAFKSLSDLCDLLSIKTCLGKRARKAYKAKDNEKLADVLANFKLVDKKLKKFISSYRDQWYIENKAFGFEVTDGRLGFLQERISTAIWRIENYLSKNIQKIEEFEEDVLPYNGSPKDEPHCYNNWAEIVTASVI